MLLSLGRWLCSVTVAICFGYNAMAPATLTGCGPMDEAGAHASHHRSGSHAPGHVPNLTHCLVHLCCAHVTPTAALKLPVARVNNLVGAPGFVPAANAAPGRSPHSLPFAQAPPIVVG